MAMLSLMFSLCIDGQPCKENYVADFFGSSAVTMCDENKISMARDLGSLPPNARRSHFECRPVEFAKVANNKPETYTELVFEVTSPEADKSKQTLAKFYGLVGAPLCGRNRAHYESPLKASAASLKAESKLYCVET